MTGRYLGVDLGSTTAKAVVIDQDGAILAASTVQMGAVSQRGMQRAVDAALQEARVAADGLDGTVATGYGRRLVPGVARTYTEITCHARHRRDVPRRPAGDRHRRPGQQGHHG